MCRPQHGLSSAGRSNKTTVADSRIAAMKKPRFRGCQSLSIGVPRFELGTSCPPGRSRQKSHAASEFQKWTETAKPRGFAGKGPRKLSHIANIRDDTYW